MILEINSIEADSSALEPTLSVHICITYYNWCEVPTYISGKLNSPAGKTIAYLNEFHARNRDFSGLKALFPNQKSNELTRQKSTYRANLTLPLSHKAIEHIEECREKDGEKAVHFNFKFILKYIEVDSEPGDNFCLMHKTIEDNGYYKIPQSEWVRKFSPALGIGNFLLLELEIPQDFVVEKFWNDMYKRLSLKLVEIQDTLKNGDWQRSMEKGRQFYEILKIGDGKKANQKFEQELKKLFKRDQHNDEGYQNFIDSHWKLFEYCSKFVHENDKNGEHKPIPIAYKEDAYLVYTLGVGLLNVIGRKTMKK